MRRTKRITDGVHTVNGMRKFTGHKKEIIDLAIASWRFGRVELPIHELKKTCSDKLGRRAVEIAGKDPRAHKAAYDSSEVVQ